MHLLCAHSLPRKPGAQPGGGDGAEESAQGSCSARLGPADSTPCMHSIAHSGASAVRPDLGPQEKPGKDTASVWGLPRPRPRTQALSRVWVRWQREQASSVPRDAGASRSGGKLSGPQRRLRNPCGPVRIADAGPLISSGEVLKAATAEQSQGQDPPRTVRGAARVSREGPGTGSVSRTGGLGREAEGALPGARGRPARGVQKEGQEAQPGGLEPLIPRACDPRQLLSREWRTRVCVEESRPASWEAESCPPTSWATPFR